MDIDARLGSGHSNYRLRGRLWRSERRSPVIDPQSHGDGDLFRC